VAAEDVITLDDALDHLNYESPTSAEQAEIGVHVTAASQAVDYFVGPVIVREFTDYEVCGRYSLVLDRRPVVDLVSITPCDGGSALDVDGYRVVPNAGLVRPLAGGRLRGGPFDVVYTAGHAADVGVVPEALALACRIIVAHLWQTQRGATLGPQPGAFGEDLATGSGGSGYAIPYRARDLMAPFRTVAVA
jgi:hypothetical protein